MSDTYYLKQGGEQTGPYTYPELIKLDFHGDDRLLSSAHDDWRHAWDLPEFNNYFKAKGIYFPTTDNLASFWWRLLAYIIDSFVLFILIMIVLSALGNKVDLAAINLNDQKTRLIANLISFGTYIVYSAIFEATKMQGSIGKKLCNLAVVDANGMRISFLNALGRNTGKLFSSLVLCIGYLMIFFNEHRQAWHDQIAKTYVIRKD